MARMADTARAHSASSNNAAAWSMALLVGVLVGALAPRIAAPGDRAAGEPFVYTPPAGFIPATEAASSRGPDLESTTTTTRLWAKPVVPNLLGPPKYRPQISEIHTPKRAPLEDSELAAVAAGL